MRLCFAWNEGSLLQIKEQDLPVLKVRYNEGLSKKLVYRKHRQDLEHVKDQAAVELQCDSAAW